MQLRVGLALALALVTCLGLGCTKSNPKSCTDGSCTEPSLPFCDVDGALSGEPMTCISVDCTPGEFTACRGEQAIQCNSSGADYDLVQCELGCNASTGGCKECNDNSSCSNPTPTCDQADFRCRACSSDGECASTVCDPETGFCRASTEVVYASPEGQTTNACTQQDPCALPRAIALALANPLRSTVRMLPGNYVSSLSLSTGTITIVGTGATLSAEDPSGHKIRRGAEVSIRGLTFRLTTGALYCGWGNADTTPLGGTLRLRDVYIVAENARTLETQGCLAIGTNVTVENISAYPPVIRDDTEFRFDRSRFFSPTATGFVLLMGARVNLSITNSILDNVFMDFDPRDQTGSSSRAVFAFNTVVRTGSLALNREDPSFSGNTGTFTTVIENNIFVVGTGNDAVICPGCTLANNIINRQQTALPGSNLIVDPKLADPANHDFHLQSGSPAIDAATPTVGSTADHDYEGSRRPQGPRPDIGAFEREP